MLISSHLLRDIDETCDEVLILNKGRIAAISNIEEERRSHRNFIEMEMAGSTEEFAQKMRVAGLRVRELCRWTREAGDARCAECARSLRDGGGIWRADPAHSVSGATRWKISSCGLWITREAG